MAEDAGDLFHDRQAQAQATVLVRALHIAASELLEHFFQVLFGDTDPAVPYLDPQAATLAPAAQHHAAAAGVANRIAEQVAQDPRQQLNVTAHHGGTAHEMQLKPFAARHLGVFGSEVVHQFAQGERGDISLDHAGIKLGNIHQGT
ncbi:hypothetical protein D3C80_753150 [compost metagenome]